MTRIYTNEEKISPQKSFVKIRVIRGKEKAIRVIRAIRGKKIR